MSKKISLSKIKEIVLASLDKNGKFPSPREMTTFDDIGYPGETAIALNSSIRNGGRGLDMDPDWINLKNSLPLGTKPSLAMLDPSNQFTLSAIKKAAMSYLAENGIFPSASVNAKFDAFGFINETSGSINSALRSGARGLSRDPGWRALKDELGDEISPSLAMLDPFHNLTLSQVRKMVDLSVARNGRYPSVGRRTTFDDCGFPGETALGLDSSLRLGGRGLSRDPEWQALRSSLPDGMVPTLASLDRQPLLTLRFIKDVVTASFEKHKIFPSATDNASFADLGHPRESASSFDTALHSGGRGLALDPEWQHFRAQLPVGVTPSLSLLNPFNQLTLGKIREITNAYVKKYGVFPSSSKQIYFDDIGYPGESAKALNSTIRRGGRGLALDPEWRSLRESVPASSSPALSMLDPEKSLTIARITKIVERAIAANGRPPSVVQETPLAEFSFPGETARTLDRTLRNGWRGLSRDPEWKKLKDQLAPGMKLGLSVITARFFPRTSSIGNDRRAI